MYIRVCVMCVGCCMTTCQSVTWGVPTSPLVYRWSACCVIVYNSQYRGAYIRVCLMCVGCCMTICPSMTWGVPAIPLVYRWSACLLPTALCRMPTVNMSRKTGTHTMCAFENVLDFMVNLGLENFPWNFLVLASPCFKVLCNHQLMKR